MVYITDTTANILFPRTVSGTAPDELSVRSQETGREYVFGTLSCFASGDYWAAAVPDGLKDLPDGQYDYVLSVYSEAVDGGVLQIGTATAPVNEYTTELTYKQYGD